MQYKRLQSPENGHGRRLPFHAATADRQGSVLLVVIGLLGMLLLLGLTFYAFSTQEQASSQYYAEAAKDQDEPDVERLWTFALDQLILGPSNPNLRQSALWGRRHALLTGVLGRTDAAQYDGFDLNPYNGTGINLKYSAAGDAFVDQDFDGTPDADQSLLNTINYSWSANGGSNAVPIGGAPLDVDYTTPDVNSLALGFVGYGLNSTNGADIKVIIPSFHRPQVLRSGGIPISDWETNPATATRILRPHPSHEALMWDANLSQYVQSPTHVKRFISPVVAPALLPTNAMGQTVQPFPFGDSTTMKQGVWDLSAPPTVTPAYQWDVDNDFDNVKEGIWMDLDYPVQTLADGRKYVPLFSYTVIDADGLINLNLSGNMTGLTSPTPPLANYQFASRSNQGLSRAEINPSWGMYGDPASNLGATTQHSLFWSANSSSLTRNEMANMESVFLNIGRPDFSVKIGGTYTVPGGPATTYEPTKYYTGRYGELVLMGPNVLSPNGIAGIAQGGSRDFNYLPKPGQSVDLAGAAGDDDLDAAFGHSRYDNAGYFFMGTSFLRLQSNTNVPSFVHPLDFQGSGLNLLPGVTGLRMQLANTGLTTPMVWPYYSTGYSSPGTDTTGSGFINYLTAGASNLLPASNSQQRDEADEIIAEWEIATTNATMLSDSVFGPDDMFELQGTNSDLTNTNFQARVRDLAPFNFTSAAQSEAIRRQYTTLSHDRKNFGRPPLNRRAYDLVDTDSDGNREFPPVFTGTDPIRLPIRQLFYSEDNQTIASTNLAQLRLNLNRLLTQYDTVNGPVVAGAPLGAPIYRELTSHPAPSVTLANTVLTASAWNPDNAVGSPTAADLEWWARVDRQHLARDIYVLLYTFGGGIDGTPYTASNAGNGLYSNEQLREMAQFAVNFVDELDRDDVITKFEYDKNLADGWSVSDNAYDTTDNGVADRAYVYGVEAQKLTLSEVLGFVSKKIVDSMGNAVDHPSTQIKDDQGDSYFTYMELRNASPFNVDLANGAWQIAVQAGHGADGIPNTGDETDIVELTPYRASTSALSTIAAGGTFTIGTRGGPAQTDPNDATKNLPSVFRLEYTTGKVTPTPTFPDFTTEATVIAPQTSTSLNLDLIPTNSGTLNVATQFRISDGTASVLGSGADVTAAGAFLDAANVTNLGNPLYFILRRRANLNRQMPIVYTGATAANHVPQSQDNPWIEVDRMTLTWSQFQLAKDAAADEPTRAMEMQNELATQSLRSMERAQPFSRNLQENTHPAVAAAPYQSHTVGGINSTSPATFSQVQLHFDRDFASTIDLLAIPLYGPDDVTRRVGQTAKFDRPYSLPILPAADKTSYLAQERFLRPMHIDNLNARLAAVPLTYPTMFAAVTATSAASDIPIKDNRWYRILELLEVPTQSEQGMRVYPYALRTSGAINLNTMRTRGVLAGLIDDPDNPDNPSAPNPPYEGHLNPQFISESVMLVDTFEPGSRDWWLQFLASRDGVEPVTQLILPGTPQGRPFRSLTFADRGSNSVDDTLLRGLPLDLFTSASAANFSDRRTLFEARMNTDRPSVGGGDFVDPLSKLRLLRKVANNSTTRSNVFAVWITTRYFEAIEETTGEIRIGAALDGTPDHRGFFVIDRSLPESAFNTDTGKFDFRKFVQYRKTIQ